MPISSLNPLFNHLLESSHRDDSIKQSNIGFGEETTQEESYEINIYAPYLELWLLSFLDIICHNAQTGLLWSLTYFSEKRTALLIITVCIYTMLLLWPWCGYWCFTNTLGTKLYKGFPWFTGWSWLIRFDFTTVPNGDSGQSGLTLQLFPMETIVTSNLIGQNKWIVQWNCFRQFDAEEL